jgi:RecA-family ATPase
MSGAEIFAAATVDGPLPFAWHVPLQQGWVCIPIPLGQKRPQIKWAHYRDQPPSPEVVRAWARQKSNVGILTGSVSGIVVLDLDNDAAIAEAEARGLPTTVMVGTGRGRHYYFRHPGYPVRNGVCLFEGADFRGDGGLVVAPGSVHEIGTEYAWITSPNLVEIADMPAWLVDLVNPPAASLHGAEKNADARLADRTGSAEETIELHLGRLSCAKEGKRNDQLNKSTFALAQLPARASVNDQDIKARLHAIAKTIGLSAGEIESTIRRAWSDGRQSKQIGSCGNVESLASPNMPADAVASDGSLQGLDLSVLAKIDPKPKLFAIDRVAPLAEVTLFTGPGGGGKSLLAQQFATAAAAGISCLRFNVLASPAIYLTCEDDEDQLHWRQKHICASLGVDMATLDGRLHLISLRGALDNELGTFAQDKTFKPSAAYRRLATRVEDTGARLVCLDNVSHLFTGNENDRGDVTRFLNLLNRLAGETGAAIVLLAHPPKPPNPNTRGHDYSGSTAWLNAVRSQFTIDYKEIGEEADPDARVITVGKSNYSRKGGPISCRWRDWAFVHDDDLPADAAREIVESIRFKNEERIFLECLAVRNKERRQVSEKPNASNFAPKVFKEMPEGKSITRNRFVEAMNRLYRKEAIERGFLYRNTVEGKNIEGLREVVKSVAKDPEGDPGSNRE